MFAPGLRKFTLTAHITASVGWLGSVAAFLALAIAGLRSQDPQTTRAAYQGADLVTTWMILPLCGASLMTGLVQALGTTWGLFRHYWVITKLLITVLSTLILLLHSQAIRHLAIAAAGRDLAPGDLRQLRVQLVVDAAAAIIALLAATALSVYKPRGVTPYGWRKQQVDRERVS